MKNIILKYNIPSKVTTDNGSSFTAETIKQITRLLKIKKILTTTYHPQSNVVERWHRTLGEYLKIFTEKERSNWHNTLQFGVFSYNNTVHTATGFTPNDLAFGFTVKIPTNITDRPVPVYNYENYRDELRRQLYEAQDIAKKQINKRKEENKRQYDKHCNPIDLEEGDLVLIRKEVKNGKYDYPFEDPYTVEKIISDTNVLIKRGNKIIRIHKNTLRKAEADYTNSN